MGIEAQDGRIDTGALWNVLQELEEGTLAPDKRDELMVIIARSPAAQKSYLEFFEMAAMLGIEAETYAEQGKMPVVGRSQLPIRLFRRALLAAAAVLVLGAFVASLFIVKLPKPMVAEATEGAVWAVDGTPQDLDGGETIVKAGSTVQVRSGTLRLGLDSGAAMVIQGPARVSFRKLEEPIVYHGWLWIDSGDSDKGFEVATSKLLIRDIGTRFAVHVPAEGPAEIHTIEGKVEVLVKSSRKRIVLLEPEGKGVSIEASGGMVGVALARDPFPEIAKLLASPGNYATTVASQNPAGYWRMEDGKSRNLENEISTGSLGRRHQEAGAAAPGPGPSDGFKGFGESNGAIRLSGEPVRTQISLGASPIHKGILFHENFSGEGALNDTAPDDTGGDVKWIASPSFRKDGSVTPGAGSATLAFLPVDGVNYTLDASVKGLSGRGSWVAFGFANGQSKEDGVNSRFITNAVVGRAWMLARGFLSTGPNIAYLGASGTNGGLADTRAWNESMVDLRGDVDLRVKLDTSRGLGEWEATWYAKRPDEKSYTVVRATQQLLNEEIRSVGLAINGTDTSGMIKNFSLRADLSERADPEANRAGAPANGSRMEGAISFWINRAPGARHREILWTAGESPSEKAIQVHLEPDGRAGVFMENGRFDVLLSSANSISDGRWHHVAASWSREAVNLYLDGRLMAWSTDYRRTQQGVLTEAQFGSGAAESGAATFGGMVDEIAQWNRNLTTAEVLHQFRSAKGQ